MSQIVKSKQSEGWGTRPRNGASWQPAPKASSPPGPGEPRSLPHQRRFSHTTDLTQKLPSWIQKGDSYAHRKGRNTSVCPFSTPSHPEQLLLFNHVRTWSSFPERFSCREKSLFGGEPIIDVETSEMERPWVFKDPSCQTTSLRLWGPAERRRRCCHRRCVCLCSLREAHTDITSERQEETRRGCPSC